MDIDSRSNEQGGQARILAELEGTRAALRELARRLPLQDRSARAVTGTWSLREVIIHLTEWEKIGLVYAERTLNGETTQVLPGFSEDRVDEINAAFIESRQEERWEEVWESYSRTRQTMIETLKKAPLQVLDRVLIPPWDGTLSLGEFFSAWSEHDQEHIEMIRQETRLFD